MKRPKGKFSFVQCLLHLLDRHMLLVKNVALQKDSGIINCAIKSEARS